ncbi:MAG: hypothetical protein LJF06_14490 [Gemmatimonadetes bacterium]|nr:hypothetical protein [Gemmatimonadota bacterium]
MSGPDGGAILTLEPLVEAVREGVEPSGWRLSGLQKTTSYEFQGRWEGDSTRSAYLFFHPSPGPDWATLDVFLDETSRGLSGNLALVVDARSLSELGDVTGSLGALAELARGHLPRRYRAPLTLRMHLETLDADPGSAQAEIRFKVRIPRSCIASGVPDVSAMAAKAASALRALLEDPGLTPFLDVR